MKYHCININLINNEHNNNKLTYLKRHNKTIEFLYKLQHSGFI